VAGAQPDAQPGPPDRHLPGRPRGSAPGPPPDPGLPGPRLHELVDLRAHHPRGAPGLHLEARADRALPPRHHLAARPLRDALPHRGPHLLRQARGRVVSSRRPPGSRRRGDGGFTGRGRSGRSVASGRRPG
jgi:hypothetical protein